uniref:Integrase catalytic domain-containing protein n=1 Tax=Phytophthora ramorum TaxID=164328 RepID=H3G517_PHYRM
FVDLVFRHHGMPFDIMSDRDPRFTARFWQEVFTLLGTQLPSQLRITHRLTDKPSMSTAC